MRHHRSKSLLKAMGTFGGGCTYEGEAQMNIHYCLDWVGMSEAGGHL